MAQTNYTPISLYYSTTASAAPTSGNLVNGELAINITDGKLYYKSNAGAVTLLASAAGASGDVVGPSSATDNALARFDTTTGKLIQNSVGILSDAGVLTGLTGLTSSGAITLSSLTSGRVTYAGASGLLQDSANLTFNGTTLTLTGLNNTGNTTLGDAAADTLTVNATITSNLIFTDNTYDIGASGATRPRSIYLAGNATLGGSNGVNLTANAAKFQSTYGGVTTTNLFTDSGGGVLSVDGANTISLRVGGVSGTSALVVGGTGNIGIGESSPLNSLVVKRVGSAATIQIVSGTAGQNAQIVYTSTIGSWYNGQNILATSGELEWYNGSERMILDVNGRLGINTSTTALSQYLSIGGSGGTLAGTAAISFWDGNSGGSRRWAIANGASATGTTQIGALTFNVGSGSFTADPLSAGTEVARFSSSGNMGIGTNSPAGRLHVNGNDGPLRISGSGYTTNPTEFTLGLYSSTIGYLQIPGTTGRIDIWDGGTGAAVIFNAYGVGLYGTPPTSGSGITFPSTQQASSNANTLDDYEEGTWSPTLSPGSNISSMSSNSCRYTKIGNMVICTGNITGTTSGAGTVNFTMTGPFSMIAVQDVGQLGTISIYPYAGTYKQVGYVIDNSGGEATSMYCELYVSTGASVTIRFQLAYQTA